MAASSRQRWQAPVIWRWFAGRDLDDPEGRTDATWLHDATKVKAWHGNASRWARMRHWKRSAIRNGIIITAAVTAWDLRYHLAVTLAILAGALLLLSAHGISRAVTAIRLWQHNRHYASPLEYALTPILGVPPAALQVKPDRSEVKLWLPEEFTAGEDGRARAAITQAVTAKLAIEAPDAEWKLAGRTPHVIFTKSEPPPQLVTLPDIRSHIAAAEPHEIVLGLGRKRQVIKVSLDTETPHLGLSMTTGDGKSTVAQNFAAQMAYHGAIPVFLDYKLFSHMWARGLPNIAYAGTPEEIHRFLCWLGYDDDEHESELTRRKNVGLATADYGGNVHGNVGDRIVLIMEEINATQKKLKAYWKRTGGRGASPACEALDEVLFTGRQLLVNALYIGQRLSARASGSDGSGDAREQLGTIVTKDPTDATWKMLAGGHVQPPKSGHPGRYQVITRKEVREMQGVLYDRDPLRAGQMARGLALAGTAAVPRFDMPYVWRPAEPVLAGIGQSQSAAGEPADQGTVIGPEPPVLPAGHGPRDAVTLAEAAAAGMFASISAARKAAQRRCWEPVGGDKSAGFRYALADLYEYQRSKERR